MKKLSLLVLTSVLLLVHCGPVDNLTSPLLQGAPAMLKTSKAYAAVQPVSEADFSVSGLMIGAQYSDIVAALGQPHAVITVQREYDTQHATLQYEGAVITATYHNDYDISSGRLYNIKVSSPAYQSSRGIRVGQSGDDVEVVYGEASYLTMYTDQATNERYLQIQYANADGFQILIFYVNVATNRVDFIEMADTV